MRQLGVLYDVISEQKYLCVHVSFSNLGIIVVFDNGCFKSYKK